MISRSQSPFHEVLSSLLLSSPYRPREEWYFFPFLNPLNKVEIDLHHSLDIVGPIHTSSICFQKGKFWKIENNIFIGLCPDSLVTSGSYLGLCLEKMLSALVLITYLQRRV